MSTAYYIMKMMKSKKKTLFDQYYQELPTTCSKIKDIHSKCRICLKKGTVSIYDDENAEITEVIQDIGSINISEHDDLPKLLCKTCFHFTKAAILFRNTAKRSDEILRQPVKEEHFDYMQDSNHDYDDSSIGLEPKLSDDWSNNHNEEESISVIKVEQKKDKPSVKVTCHVCNKVINRSYYKEHITMHDPNHKQYVCDVCGKSFRLRCAYHNHSLRHSDDFPYKCNFCPYKGRYKELLKTHLRTHTGDYRYMCTECPARFLFKSNLNSHMLKHKEPQFKCDSCKRAFHTKLMLQRHFEADHLGIKNHVCNICGKAFGYRNAMMKHQRHVHKREKFLFGRMPAYLEAEHKNVNT